jgi:hypothetical protein
MLVDAADNYVFNQSVSLPKGTTKIQPNAYTSADKLIGEQDSWEESENSVEEIKTNTGIDYNKVDLQ